MKIKDLAIEHDYRGSESNYYSRKCTYYYETWEDFFEEMGNVNIDYNLVYRWDIYKDEYQNYSMNLYIIGQRKGIYSAALIESVTDKDVRSIIEYINRSWQKLKQIWEPISQLH